MGNWEYAIGDTPADLEERFGFSEKATKFLPDELEWAAETAAQDYYGNHDGWECKWPLMFVIFRDDQEVCRMWIELDWEPRFDARDMELTEPSALIEQEKQRVEASQK